MVLNQKQTTIAYRCPSCGRGVMSIVGVFALSGDMMKLKCECGQSELIIVYTKDKKVRLTVPCIICPKPHNYTISASIFFGRDLFLLPCALSGVDICFLGGQSEVENALKKAEKDLLAMLTEAGLDDFNTFDDDDESETPIDTDTLGNLNLQALRKNNSGAELFTDPQVLDIIMFVIHDLQDEGKIYCLCEDGEGDYSVSIEDEHVIVSCDKCNASVKIPASSTLSAHAFLHSDSLELNRG